MNQLISRLLAVWLVSAWALAPAAAQQSVDIAQLDELIAQSRAQWDVPGLAVAIVHDGDVLLSRGYGVRESGANDPVDAHTLFAIASNTKAFTAAGLAILVDRQQLDWDDPVRKHLPYFELYDPYVSADIRVRDLLCHRSGLGTFSGDLLWYGTSFLPEEVLRRCRYLAPAGPFRAHYGYSNLMFIAAGEVATSVSGQDWPAFIQEEILAPLNMQRTIMSVADIAQRENVATPHKPTASDVRPIAWQHWDTVAAAGGIISCVDDMAKWIQVQLNRGQLPGGEPLFSRSASHTMWSPHTIIPISQEDRERYPATHFRAYGLGWSLADYHGRTVVTHGGGYDGMHSRVALVPEEKLGIVVLTNTMNGAPSAICNLIIDQFLNVRPVRDWNGELLAQYRKSRADFDQRVADAVRPQASDSRPSHTLDAYTGTYGGDLYGQAGVSLEEGQLVLKLLPNPQLVADLSHLHFDTFVIRWRNEFAWFDEGTAQFLSDASGTIVEMKLNVPNDDLWFDELKFERIPP